MKINAKQLKSIKNVKTGFENVRNRMKSQEIPTNL